MRSRPTSHRFPGIQHGANNPGYRPPLLPLMGQPVPYMQQHNFPSQMRNIRPFLPNHNTYPNNQRHFQNYNPSMNFPQTNMHPFNYPGSAQMPVRNFSAYKPTSNSKNSGTMYHFKDADRNKTKSEVTLSRTDASSPIDVNIQSNKKTLGKATSTNSSIQCVIDSTDQESIPNKSFPSKTNTTPLSDRVSASNESSKTSNNVPSASETADTSSQSDVHEGNLVQGSIPQTKDNLEHTLTQGVTSKQNLKPVSGTVPSKSLTTKTNRLASSKSSDRITKRVKCKIHSHKPIPWPGLVQVKTEPKDSTAVGDIIPLAKIKLEPGTSSTPTNVAIKQEPGIVSVVTPVVSSLRNNSKRNINDVSGSGNSGFKVIKLERNNVISLRPSITKQSDTISELQSKKISDPLAGKSNYNEDNDVSTPNIIPTTSLSKTIGSQSDDSIASSISTSTSSSHSSSTNTTSSNLSNSMTFQPNSITKSKASETTCPSTSTSSNTSLITTLTEPISANHNTPSQTFDTSSNNADNFLDMIYNDLAQSIPLKLSNACPPMSDTQVAKLFGFCGNVLSVEPDASTDESPSKSLLVSVRGSVAGGLAVQLLHGALVGGQELQVLPHTEKAIAAMQTLPPEVMQCDVAFQCLEAIQNYFVAEGLNFLPSTGYRTPVQDNSSLSADGGTSSVVAQCASSVALSSATSSSTDMAICHTISFPAVSTSTTSANNSTKVTVAAPKAVKDVLSAPVAAETVGTKGKRKKRSNVELLTPEGKADSIQKKSPVRPMTRSRAKTSNSKQGDKMGKKQHKKLVKQKTKKVAANKTSESNSDVVNTHPEVSVGANQSLIAASVNQKGTDGCSSTLESCDPTGEETIVPCDSICTSGTSVINPCLHETSNDTSSSSEFIGFQSSSLPPTSDSGTACTKDNEIVANITNMCTTELQSDDQPSTKTKPEPADVKPNIIELDKLIKKKSKKQKKVVSAIAQKSQELQQAGKASPVLDGTSLRVKSEPSDNYSEEACFPGFDFGSAPPPNAVDEDRKPYVESIDVAFSSSTISDSGHGSQTTLASDDTSTTDPSFDLACDSVPNVSASLHLEHDDSPSESAADNSASELFEYAAIGEEPDSLPAPDLPVIAAVGTGDQVLPNESSSQLEEMYIDLLAFKKDQCSTKWCRDTLCSMYHDMNDYIRDYTLYRGVKCREVFRPKGHRWRDPRCCSKGPHCPFAHNQLEFLFHPTNYKRFICQSIEKNKKTLCVFRENCAFRHTKEEVSVEEIHRHQKMFAEKKEQEQLLLEEQRKQSADSLPMEERGDTASMWTGCDPSSRANAQVTMTPTQPSPAVEAPPTAMELPLPGHPPHGPPPTSFPLQGLPPLRLPPPGLPPYGLPPPGLPPPGFAPPSFPPPRQPPPGLPPLGLLPPPIARLPSSLDNKKADGDSRMLHSDNGSQEFSRPENARSALTKSTELNYNPTNDMERAMPVTACRPPSIDAGCGVKKSITSAETLIKQSDNLCCRERSTLISGADGDRSCIVPKAKTVDPNEKNDNVLDAQRNLSPNKRPLDFDERVMPPNKFAAIGNNMDKSPLKRLIKKEPALEDYENASACEMKENYSLYKTNIVTPDECREITPLENKFLKDSVPLSLGGALEGLKVVEDLKTLSEFSSNFGMMGALLPIVHKAASMLLKDGNDPLAVFEDSDNATLLTLLQKKIPKLRETTEDLEYLEKVEFSLQTLIERVENSASVCNSYMGLDIAAIARGTLGFSAEEIAYFVRQVLKCEGKPVPTSDQMHAIGMAVAGKHFKNSLNTTSLLTINKRKEQTFTPKPSLPVKPFDRNYDQKKVASVTPSDVLPIRSRSVDQLQASSVSPLPPDVVPRSSSPTPRESVAESSIGTDIDLRHLPPTDLRALDIRISDAFGPAVDSADTASVSSDQDMRIRQPLPAPPALATRRGPQQTPPLPSEPATRTVQQPPRMPSERAPRTPSERAPRTPSERAPRTPSERAPRTPSERAPRTPSERAPRTPSERAPRTPSERAPRTPSECAPRTVLQHQSPPVSSELNLGRNQHQSPSDSSELVPNLSHNRNVPDSEHEAGSGNLLTDENPRHTDPKEAKRRGGNVVVWESPSFREKRSVVDMDISSEHSDNEAEMDPSRFVEGDEAAEEKYFPPERFNTDSEEISRDYERSSWRGSITYDNKDSSTLGGWNSRGEDTAELGHYDRVGLPSRSSHHGRETGRRIESENQQSFSDNRGTPSHPCGKEFVQESLTKTDSDHRSNARLRGDSPYQRPVSAQSSTDNYASKRRFADDCEPVETRNVSETYHKEHTSTEHDGMSSHSRNINSVSESNRRLSPNANVLSNQKQSQSPSPTDSWRSLSHVPSVSERPPSTDPTHVWRTLSVTSAKPNSNLTSGPQRSPSDEPSTSQPPPRKLNPPVYTSIEKKTKPHHNPYVRNLSSMPEIDVNNPYGRKDSRATADIDCRGSPDPTVNPYLKPPPFFANPSAFHTKPPPWKSNDKMLPSDNSSRNFANSLSKPTRPLQRSLDHSSFSGHANVHPNTVVKVENMEEDSYYERPLSQASNNFDVPSFTPVAQSPASPPPASLTTCSAPQSGDKWYASTPTAPRRPSIYNIRQIEQTPPATDLYNPSHKRTPPNFKTPSVLPPRHTPSSSHGSEERTRRTPSSSHGSEERTRHTPSSSHGSEERTRHTPSSSHGSEERTRHTPSSSHGSEERTRHTPSSSHGSEERTRHTPSRSHGSEERTSVLGKTAMETSSLLTASARPPSTKSFDGTTTSDPPRYIGPATSQSSDNERRFNNTSFETTSATSQISVCVDGEAFGLSSQGESRWKKTVSPSSSYWGTCSPLTSGHTPRDQTPVSSQGKSFRSAFAGSPTKSSCSDDDQQSPDRNRLFICDDTDSPSSPNDSKHLSPPHESEQMIGRAGDIVDDSPVTPHSSRNTPSVEAKSSNKETPPQMEIFNTPMMVKPLFSPRRKEWNPPEQSLVVPPSPWQALSLKSNDFDFVATGSSALCTTPKAKDPSHIHGFLQKQGQLVQQFSTGGSSLSRTKLSTQASSDVSHNSRSPTLSIHSEATSLSKKASTKIIDDEVARTFKDVPVFITRRHDFDHGSNGSSTENSVGEDFVTTLEEEQSSNKSVLTDAALQPFGQKSIKSLPDGELEAAKDVQVDSQKGKECPQKTISNRYMESGEPSKSSASVVSNVDVRESSATPEKRQGQKTDKELKAKVVTDEKADSSDDDDGGLSLDFEDMLELLQNFTQLEKEEQIAFSTYLRNLKEKDPSTIERLYATAKMSKK